MRLLLPFMPCHNRFLALLALTTAISVMATSPPRSSLLIAQWQQLMGANRVLTDQQILRRVNRFFNQHLLFAEDTDIWRQADYWATPVETLSRQAGDCEDFSIAKYISLLQSGIAADKLRLVYVTATTGLPQSPLQQAHMVVAYYADKNAEPLILDNLTPQILRASERPDLQPLFSFNSQGLWVGEQQASLHPQQHLSRWRAVLQRMAREGFYSGVPNRH